MNTKILYDKFKEIALAKFVEVFDWGNAQDESQLKKCIEYFFDCGELNRAKGLLVRGHFGSGKTMLFRVIQKMRKEPLMLNPCDTVVSDFNEGGDEAIKRYKVEHERVFDDLGTERKGRFYQSEANVMSEIILARYDLFQRSGIRTHFTTNLSNKELKSMYGDRVYDRLLEMITVVTLGGSSAFKSRRTTSTPKQRQKVPQNEEFAIDKKSPEFLKECYDTLVRLTKQEKKVPSHGPFTHAFKHAFQKQLVETDHKKMSAFKESVRKSLEQEKKLHMKGSFDRIMIEGQLTNDQLLRDECKKRAMIKHLETFAK